MKKNKRISVRIMIYITMATILIFGYQSIQLIRISHTLDQQTKESKREISVEKQKLEALQKEYSEMNSLENIEKVARDKLGLVKKDEIVFKAKP